MKYIILLCFFLTSLMFGQMNKISDKETPKLTFLWESDTVLNTIESVVYDKKRNVIYTSNINGHWMKKHGTGYISKLDLMGKVITKKWVSGLEGTTGITIHKDKLYAADFDYILVIDLDEAKVIERIHVKGAQRMNDISITMSGVIYATDTPTGNVYKIENGMTETILKGLKRPNGILAQKNGLMIGMKKPQGVNRMNYMTGMRTAFTMGIKSPDGIVAIGDNYLISSWEGRVFFVDKNGMKTEILNTSADKINAADISYITETRTLLVPAMKKNKLVAYRLDYVK